MMARSKIVFTEEQSRVIRVHWNGRNAKISFDIASILRAAFKGNITVDSVRRQARILKLERDDGFEDVVWPEWQKEIIRDNYADMDGLGDVDIGRKVGKSFAAVRMWARADGLDRPIGWAQMRRLKGSIKGAEIAALKTTGMSQAARSGEILASAWPEHEGRLHQDNPAILDRYLNRWQPVWLQGAEVRGASSLVSVTHYSRPQNRGASA